MTPARRILISGWYGFGNVGDEAILQALVDRFGAASPGARIAALSYRPRYTRRVQQIGAAHQLPFTARSWISWLVKCRWIGTMWQFLRCDTFVMGGGGFLSDWQPDVPRGWLKQFRLARLLGKRTQLFGIGAGPFRTAAGRATVGHYVNRYVDEVTVRDDESYRCLVEDCGVEPGKVSIEIDPVATMDLARWCDRDATRRGIGIVYTNYFDRPIFGEAQSRWPLLRECFLAQIAAVRRAGFPVRLIFFQPEIEQALASDLGSAADAGCAFPGDYKDAAFEMSRCEGIISFRLHGNILAHAMGMPYLPIVYHHKGIGFLAMLGRTDPMDRIVIGDGINLPDAPLDPAEWVARTERFLEKVVQARHG
jgi:polysaccharide pyruvyl transferase WcaK-like protein